MSNLAVSDTAASYADADRAAPGEGDGFVRWSKDGGKYTLRFVGNTTGEPVLSRLSRLFDVEFNIRAGGIQHLTDKNIGTLITDISGSPAELEKALHWLQTQGVIVETEGTEETAPAVRGQKSGAQ